jgi:phosphoglycerate dehydrogenase-like enzyme
MDDTTVLVLANPVEPQLAMLENLPPATTIVAGDKMEAFERTVERADVIFSWSIAGELLETLFHRAPRLRWIHSRSAGLDGVLFPALAGSPVPLTNGTGVFSQPLGEFVMAAALFFAKDLRRMVRSQERGVWDPFDVIELRGQTIGIVGYGDIGRAIARRARCFDMRVLALRRRPERSARDPLVDEVLPLSGKIDLMGRCDYVAVAAPLTPETRGMIGEPELRAMKPSAVIMNVGRGPVIQEPALVRALEQGWIRGAALDVFDLEPLPAGHPFYRLPNVLLSPHCADHTPEWLNDAMKFFLDNFERFQNGQPLRNVVDKTQGY